jgi:hypothetical protein
VQVLVGDGTVYTLGFHNAATMTNTSRPLGPAGRGPGDGH